MPKQIDGWAIQQYFYKLSRLKQALLLEFISSNMRKRGYAKQITEEEYTFQTGSGCPVRRATGIAVFQNKTKQSDHTCQWTLMSEAFKVGDPDFVFCQSILLVTQQQKDILAGMNVEVRYYLGLSPGFTAKIVKQMEKLAEQSTSEPA